MSATFAQQSWKDLSMAPGTPINQPYTQSVARKKLEHYSYLLTDAIGKGYSSQVFRGRNDLTKEHVAIKVINMAMLKSDVHQALLASQIDCLKSMNGCPNIIQLYEVYTTKNNTYIITELCEDGDMSKFIKKKKIPEQKALQMIQQLVAGYLQIYRRGILHRDIKPANIFIKGDTIKIADFGFAIRMEDHRKTANYNVGSPLYMPPQALTSNKYSYKSDIWALGVVLFEMITGTAPWKAKSEQDLSRKICSEPIESILPQDIGSIATDFLIKTLQSDVNSRMTPEQLERFCFSPKYFIDLKTSVKLQSHQRARSFMKSSRNMSIPRIDIQTPKGSLAPALPSGQKSSRQDLTNQSYRVGESQKTQRTINRKEISNQILSEVHFCRFLYKLIIRLNESKLDGLESLKQQLAVIIGYKLSEVCSLERFNVYKIDGYRQYRETNDFRKIMSIAGQYEEKYRDLLQHYGKDRRENYQAASQDAVLAAKVIFARLEYTQPEKLLQVRGELVLLDYIITTYQLIQLAALKDISEFHNKSKIEAIVEGGPTHIGIGHLKAIREKMVKLQLI